MNIKILTIILATLLSYTTTTAQTKIGLKAGPQYIQYLSTFGYIQHYKRFFGWQAGGYINHSFSKVFSIQGDLLLSHKGYYYGAWYILGKATYNYIDVPLLMKFTSPININFHIGYQPSITVYCNDKDLRKYIIKDPFPPKTNKTIYNSLLVGIGYQRKRIGIEARYYFSISDVLIKPSKIHSIQASLLYNLFNSEK